MPNTGKPSRDCHLCRSRRVKCDLRRPACQRCETYGVPCPGYRNEQDLVFRNQGLPTFARKSDKPPRRSGPGAKSRQIKDSTSNVVKDHPKTVDVRRPTRITLVQELGQDWAQQSLQFILSGHSRLWGAEPCQDTGQLDSDGPLFWAACLFSRTYTTNIHHPTSVRRDALADNQLELGQCLGQALSRVNMQLRTRHGPKRDDVLLTVLTLSHYELLVGSLTRAWPLTPLHIHAEGVYAILKDRGVAALQSRDKRMLFWAAYSIVQLNALVSNVECPPESQSWMEAIKPLLCEDERYAFHTAIFIIRATRIIRRTVVTLASRDATAINNLLPVTRKEVHIAESQFFTFTTRHPPKHDQDKDWLVLQRAVTIKAHRMVDYLINFITHEDNLSTKLRKSLSLQQQEGATAAQSAAHDLLQIASPTIDALSLGPSHPPPHALYRTMKFVWPLTAVYIFEPTLPEQKKAAAASLLRLGKAFGVQQALMSLTYYDKPTPLEIRRARPFAIPQEAKVPKVSLEDSEG